VTPSANRTSDGEQCNTLVASRIYAGDGDVTPTPDRFEMGVKKSIDKTADGGFFTSDSMLG